MRGTGGAGGGRSVGGECRRLFSQRAYTMVGYNVDYVARAARSVGR